MIWFFHSNATETSFSRTSRATANSAPVNIGAAATRKTPSNRGFSISNLNQGMTCTRPRTLLQAMFTHGILGFKSTTVGRERRWQPSQSAERRRRRRFIMAAPLARLANAFDAPSAPTPTATMAAASIARIWLLLFLADTLGRATD